MFSNIPEYETLMQEMTKYEQKTRKKKLSASQKAKEDEIKRLCPLSPAYSRYSSSKPAKATSCTNSCAIYSA